MPKYTDEKLICEWALGSRALPEVFVEMSRLWGVVLVSPELRSAAKDTIAVFVVLNLYYYEICNVNIPAISPLWNSRWNIRKAWAIVYTVGAELVPLPATESMCGEIWTGTVYLSQKDFSMRYFEKVKTRENFRITQQANLWNRITRTVFSRLWIVAHPSLELRNVAKRLSLVFFRVSFRLRYPWWTPIVLRYDLWSQKIHT